MPRAKIHNKITYISLLPTFVIGYVITQSFVDTLYLTLFTLVCALWLSPDLDTISESYNRWGLFRFLWKPYQFLFYHRSKLTHGYILAPFMRVVYILTIFLLFGYLFFCLIGKFDVDLFFTKLLLLAEEHLKLLLLFMVGLFWSNFQHVFVDKYQTKYKIYLSKMFAKI